MTTTRVKMRIPGKIAAEIGCKIVSGRLKVGSVLDGEIEASGERKVSRSAYREAIGILVAKGLVQSRPKVGTRVTETGQWHLLDPDVLSWLFVREPPRDLLVSLFELRKLVEPEAAALAAGRRSLKQLNRMGVALEVMARETLHTEQGRAADRDFHAILLSASANPFLVSLSSSVTAAVTWSTMFKERTQRLRRDAVPDHIKVYEAIAARDQNAARKAMVDLIDLAFTDATQLRHKAGASARRSRG
jgi:DNA-binding FadR family transcriptional regulator